MTRDDRLALDELDSRLLVLLPETYKDSYEQLTPAPMGSAALKYDAAGQVAWNDIWGSFCDLAMAGGPPHKGRLLAPKAPDGSASSHAYAAVVAELCRGIELATAMPCEPAPRAGWVRVECYSDTMAAWLLRAIVMENVAARAEGRALDLPASPEFRLEKEIKNVITVIAKTSHYWLEHMPRSQQRAVASLFGEMARATPLVAPPFDQDDSAGARRDLAPLTQQIERLTGLTPAPLTPGAEWIGFECGTVRAAVWLMRALVTKNVLSRREGETLWAPINSATDSNGALVSTALAAVHRLAVLRRIR